MKYLYPDDDVPYQDPEISEEELKEAIYNINRVIKFEENLSKKMDGGKKSKRSISKGKSRKVKKQKRKKTRRGRK